MSTSGGKTLLIIDDDRFFCDTMSHYLRDQDYEVLSANTIREGEQRCREGGVDVVLLDQRLPDGNGIDLCATLLQINEQSKIIFATAFPSFDNAVEALRHGAYDYLSKPLELEEVRLTVAKAFRTLELENVEMIHRYQNRREHDRHVLIGKDGGLGETYRYVTLAAGNRAPVLITGETGTGKSMVAKSIHYFHEKERGCFMAINCAALPENLIEAELFGYEKGAFTGAVAAKKGIFELADGGTIFLDEIGELPLHLQSKLLGVLDDQKIKRLGGQTFKKVSVRVLAATNVDLEDAVRRKRFRQDLFYRLSVLPIHIPPLRRRRQDIIPLCQHFLSQLAQSHTSLPQREAEKLMDYPWPGNVRELKNIIERSLMFKKNGIIHPAELLSRFPNEAAGDVAGSAGPLAPLAEVEKNHIVKVLGHVDQNHTHAARILGISRSTLLRKLKSYTINSPVA